MQFHNLELIVGLRLGYFFWVHGVDKCNFMGALCQVSSVEGLAAVYLAKETGVIWRNE